MIRTYTQQRPYAGLCEFHFPENQYIIIITRMLVMHELLTVSPVTGQARK